MSRSTRFQKLQPGNPPKRSTDEFIAKVKREVKRRMIADGILSDPSKARPKWDYHWGVPGRTGGGIVQANTKGEARAQIKTALGLKPGDRLPASIKILRFDPNATDATSDGSPEEGAATV